MKSLKICFSKKDISFINVLKDQFGENITLTENEGLNGEQIFMAVISVAALSVQLVDFFLTHMSVSKDTKINEDTQNLIRKRFIKTAEGNLFFENYSADEIQTILKEL